MTNVLITVGTTKFNSLISYLDQNLSRVDGCKFKFQIANGTYIPVNYDYVRFSDNFIEWYKSADIVITHAGAGTIYKLLNMGKKILMVPNLERRDKHQVEIAEYLHIKGHALWCKCYDEIIENLNNIHNLSFLPFQAQKFSKFDEIANFLFYESYDQ